MSRFSWFNTVSLTLGFAFLYIPMIILIIFSFNESKLVTVWAGFSTKWYGELFQNEQILDAAWVTLRVAVFSSTIATILGTAAAYVLVRGGRFFGRTLFSGMIYAPLVMPEVITGLSLLLLFIGIGLDRGILTIVLAHTTFSMCFVSVVVSSRLVTFDQSLEEAALDLGCSPAQAFRPGNPADYRPGRNLGMAAGFHALAGRSCDRILYLGAVGDDLADADILCRAIGGQSGNQRAIDDYDRGCHCGRDYRLAGDKTRDDAAATRRNGRRAHRMKRLFPDYTYGSGPRTNCWWDETIASPDWPVLQGDLNTDVAIVGGGFTGLSAALHLAETGVSVAVLEAETPGWGASGRNGGFCCLGGSMLSHNAMVRQFGEAVAISYAQAEGDAVYLVADLLATHCIGADVHSRGETQLAHTPRAMESLRRQAEASGTLHEPRDLPGLGFGEGFHGGYTNPVGFALNPRKYLFGLAQAARSRGADLFQRAVAQSIRKMQSGFEVQTDLGWIRAQNVLICTNGYSSEDIPGWMAGRYMPAQSTVLVTRPLSEAELQAQGWTSDQMAYDTRHLLHYFRLMPDGRFLFGMRGGLQSSPKAEAAIRRKVAKDFRQMFPRWAGVEVTHMWSGMVCLSQRLTPYVGPVAEQSGMFAGFAYHGNGVAMGTYCGRALARMVLGQSHALPAPITRAPEQFPLGRWRRALLPPAYAVMALADW